ncbi:FKBP53 [Scenedesmus sp. PABB004]|nr:FKBP53 [Scenedesmus sp. PABB004]
MFFGAVVRPGGKPTPLVPHSDGYALHLSQAAIHASAPEGARVSLLVRCGEEEPLVLATLRAGVTDTVLLDQFLAEYAEVSVAGDAVPVHLTGYYSPPLGAEEDEEEEDEDEDGLHGMHDMHGLAGLGGSSDEESEEGEEGEEEGESDDDDDEGGSDDDALLAAAAGLRGAGRREPSVIIEDITDAQPAPAPAKKRQAEDAPAAAGAKKQKEQAAAAKAPKQQAAAAPKQQAAAPKQQAAAAKQQAAAKTAEAKPAAGAAAQEVPGRKKDVKRYENGFEVHHLRMGDPHGKLARAGSQVKVRYVGKLKNGKVFDQTKGGKTFTFRLGVGQVIKGWDAGVQGMRVGDVRRLVVPPQMGYGGQRTGPIPPNSVLDFEVELVDVK